MSYSWNWTVYGKRNVGSLSDYMPSYKQQHINRPTSTYRPTAYSDNAGAYARDIAAAQSALNRANSNRPGAYTSEYDDRINSIINQIAGRRFEYDPNRDAAYTAIKDNYINLGRQAAADTAGQAAALTGGYGNSYGTVAANQAYQSYLNQLNDRIPELQQQALARFNAEGDQLNNMYNILANQDATAYGRHRDTMTDWENERAYRDQALNNLRSMNQNIWGQQEQNAYNANNQAWNNYWQGENYDLDAYTRALEMARNRRNDDVSYNQWADEMTMKDRDSNRAAAQTDYWNGVDNSYRYDALAQDAAQHQASLAQDQRQFEASQREKAGYNGMSDTAVSLTNNIKSQSEFNNSRRLSNNYQSYSAYVKDMIDKAKLSDDDVWYLIQYYNQRGVTI